MSSYKANQKIYRMIFCTFSQAWSRQSWTVILSLLKNKLKIIVSSNKAYKILMELQKQILKHHRYHHLLCLLTEVSWSGVVWWSPWPQERPERTPPQRTPSHSGRRSVGSPGHLLQRRGTAHSTCTTKHWNCNHYSINNAIQWNCNHYSINSVTH